MKVKEYFRLGRVSIKSRKKSTRNTVLGISFGLILLIPIIFFSLAFYVDLLSAVNKTQSVSLFEIPFTQNDASYTPEERYSSTFMFGTADRRAIEARKDAEVEEILRFEGYELASNYVITIDSFQKSSDEINQQQFMNSHDQGVRLNDKIKVVKDASFSKGVLHDLEATGHKPFAAGGDFTGEPGEVIISETLFRTIVAGASTLPSSAAAAVIGRQFSCTAQGSFAWAPTSVSSISQYGYYHDNDNNPDNNYAPQAASSSDEFTVNVLGNFRIVGVVSEDYYRLDNHTENDAHIWISSASVYDEDGVNPYAPVLRAGVNDVTEDDGTTRNVYYSVVTYSDNSLESLSEQAEQAGMFFPAVPAVKYTSLYASIYYAESFLYQQELPIETVAFQCNDYSDATDFNAFVKNRYTSALGDNGDDRFSDLDYSAEAFRNLSMLNSIGGYLMIAMYTFGGIIFFATLLNLYNSVNYSVQVRKNYMGMMQAIGARKSVIPKLYFVEIVLIFLRSLPWVLVFGGGISVGIKFGIDAIFKSDAASVLGATISLNIAYFFVALAIVFVLAFLIATLFSVVACRTITKKSIIDVLSDDK